MLKRAAAAVLAIVLAITTGCVGMERGGGAVQSCGACSGTGRVDCPRCDDGKAAGVSCGACIGEGKTACGTCGGRK